MTAHPGPCATTALTVQEANIGSIGLRLVSLTTPHKVLNVTVQRVVGVPKEVIKTRYRVHSTGRSQPLVGRERFIRAGGLRDFKPNVFHVLGLSTAFAAEDTCVRDGFQVTSTLLNTSAECHSLMRCCQIFTTAAWIACTDV